MLCIQNNVCAILQWSKKLCILACKRDPMVWDRDISFSVGDEIETEIFPHFHETETFGNYVSRLSWDRDVQNETTSLTTLHSSLRTLNFLTPKTLVEFQYYWPSATPILSICGLIYFNACKHLHLSANVWVWWWSTSNPVDDGRNFISWRPVWSKAQL